MLTSRLLLDLARPEAYPHPVESVQVIQTHISLVFLAGKYVYKIKKPVSLGFLDYSTLGQREFYCHEEVRLNRRLAPGVYLGVVPVTEVNGRLQIGGTGTVVDWAVHMRRLDADSTFEALLQRNELTPPLLHRLAIALARFHSSTPARPEDATHGSFETIARNARENFTQATTQVGQTVHPEVFARLRERTEEELARLHERFQQRMADGWIRETHGDLRLEHVYREGEQLLVIDCIEFSPRYRCADPVADLAFLVMDLVYHGRQDLADELTEAYFAEAAKLQANAAQGRELLGFYAAYRAIVRAKVAGFKASEPEVPDIGRRQARADATAHWLLALNLLEPPQHRPCLLLVGGLPGSGKSTLARNLAATENFEVIRTDEVRNEMMPGATGTTRYTPEAVERIYALCAERTRALLFQGRRVLVDASFRSEAERQRFVTLAQQLCVPVRILLAQVPAEVAHQRLAHRHQDASDADWSVHLKLAAAWEPPPAATAWFVNTVNLEGTPEEGLARARALLQAANLLRKEESP